MGIREIIFIFGLVLFVVLLVNQLEFEYFISIVSQKLTWHFYLMMFFIMNLQLLFRSIRFKLLYKFGFNQDVPIGNAFILTSASFFISLPTPNKVGDLARGLLSDRNRWEITSISVFEYLLELFVFLILPAFGLIVVYRTHFLEIIIAYHAGGFEQ